ncbi:MAG: NnrS family protein [Desulfurococcales archaeon]|nr:NnrS family protein [Desulfurococcales archaeon]
MATTFQGSSTFIKALPIMASAFIALAIGGVIGVSYIATLSGHPARGPFEGMTRLYGSHWYLMLLGFTNALISAELLTLLSMEWSRRVAPRHIIVVYLALYWLGVVTYMMGVYRVALVLASGSMLVVAYHTWRTLLSRSWIGLPPTHYNYLLTLTPIISAILILYWLASPLLGAPRYMLSIAMLILPVAAILAVESRDIPLLLGIPPGKSLALRSRGLRARATIAYATAVIGILLASAGYNMAGGVLIVISGVMGAASVSLISAIEAGSKAIPLAVRRHVGAHTALSFSWLILAGVLAVLADAGMLELNLRDALTHLLTLGFMFNVIMGIDAILLYGHAGISLSETPPPQPYPGILLNIGIALRLLYDMGILTMYSGVFSGLLTGIAILIFYIRNLRNIRRILKRKAAGA